MSFEALKSERGARLVLQALQDELNTFDGVNGRSFDHIRAGGSLFNDKMASLVGDCENVRGKIMSELTKYLAISEMAAEELNSVTDPELAALLHWRYRCNYSWTQIAAIMETHPTTDALKKRFTRLIEEHELKLKVL